MTELFKRILFCVLFLQSTLIYCQTQFSKHEISIDVFNPLQIPGQNKYFNDNWLIENYGGTVEAPQHRKYLRFGVGLEYSFFLNKNSFLNLDFGLGYRKIYEKTSFYTPNPYNHPDEVVQGATEINYKQISYGLTVFVGKSMSVNNFNFKLGIGPSYILQGIGKQKWFDWWTENVYPNLPADSTVNLVNSEFGLGHNIGLGLKTSINYVFNNQFSIGIDISSFLYYSMYNNPSKHESHYYQRKSFDGLTSQETIADGNSEDFTKFSQFSFTNISPSIRFTYLLK